MKKVLFFLFILFGCVEPFEFTRNNLNPQLVVEAYVSDVSYNESLLAPSDGRYFVVKLKFSQPIDKRIKERITPFADVKIIDDLGAEWQYYEDTKNWGTYVLPDKDFKACSDRMYKLQITTHDELISGGEVVYESTWESVPTTTPNQVEEIWFKEDTRKSYYYPAGEQKIQVEQVIDVMTSLPKNTDGESRYYRWQFSPIWIYEAPLADQEPIFKPYKTCWATDPLYLNDYEIEEDVVGSKNKVLFTLDVVKNHRLFKKFSVLIHQQRLSKDYFFFNKLMKEQAKPDGIFDTPPANLPSNITCVTDPTKNPIGYFGVVNEQTKRWYFQKDELSYHVRDFLWDACNVKFNRPESPPDPSPECQICLEYTKGKATLNKPIWWED